VPKTWLRNAIKVIRNPETQESKGFAFIDAPNTEEMNSIIRRFDRAPLEDRLLRANPAQPPKPRGQGRGPDRPSDRPAERSSDRGGDGSHRNLLRRAARLLRPEWTSVRRVVGKKSAPKKSGNGGRVAPSLKTRQSPLSFSRHPANGHATLACILHHVFR